MLKEIPAERHGFSEARIADFKEVADYLLNDLVRVGIKGIKK